MAQGPSLRISSLLILLLLGTAACSETEQDKTDDGTTISVVELLQRARQDGLISNETSRQLLQLAASLTGTRLPHTISLSLQDDARRAKDTLPSCHGNEDDGAKSKADAADTREKQPLFMKFYNQLTLLNILYFGGALLVMGAYTLFMTLAYENCRYAGMSGIMLVQVVLFGVAGITVWLHYEGFQFVGGL